MILQLNPSIPVNTPKGTGEAILIIDYSKEDDLLWTVFLDDTGQCWTFNNKEIRAIKNVSIGRNNPENSKLSSDEEHVKLANEFLTEEERNFMEYTIRAHSNIVNDIVNPSMANIVKNWT